MSALLKQQFAAIFYRVFLPPGRPASKDFIQWRFRSRKCFTLAGFPSPKRGLSQRIFLSQKDFLPHRYLCTSAS